MAPPQVPASVLAKKSRFPFHTWHRQVATLVVIPLAIVIVTGGLYRILRAWFEIPKEKCHWLLDIHVMSVWGLEKIFPVAMGVATLFLIATSLPMMWKWFRTQRRSRRTTTTPRDMHRLVGICITVPLTLTALSGIGYIVGKYYIGADKAFLKSMMKLHQFAYFSPAVYYISIIFAASILLLASGSSLLMGTDEGRPDKSAYERIPLENKTQSI